MLKAGLPLLVIAYEITDFKPRSRLAEFKDPFFHYNFSTGNL
jgi:hypothetical protein